MSRGLGLGCPESVFVRGYHRSDFLIRLHYPGRCVGFVLCPSSYSFFGAASAGHALGSGRIG